MDDCLTVLNNVYACLLKSDQNVALVHQTLYVLMSKLGHCQNMLLYSDIALLVIGELLGPSASWCKRLITGQHATWLLLTHKLVCFRDIENPCCRHFAGYVHARRQRSFPCIALP